VKSFTLAAEKSKPRWSREPSVVLDVGAGESPSADRRPAARTTSERTRVICVAADLSAGAAQQLPAGVVPVDRDELDRLLSRLSPRLRLDLPFCPELAFERWEDFHPDSLLERVPGLAALYEARRSVGDPELMQRALARSGARIDPDVPGADGAESLRNGESKRPAASDRDLLDELLGAAEPLTAGGDGVDRAIDEIVKSSSDAGDHARQDRWRAAIDAVLGDRLRAVLGHPAFRRLEATWRGLRNLVRRLPDEGARIVVLDLSQSGLGQELERGESSLDRARTALSELAPDGPAWDLLVTDFEFDAGAASRQEILHLLELGARLQRPMLAAAAGSAASIEAASEEDLRAWSELQRHPGARWLGLCAPRVLMRLPYGEQGEPVALERFEEGARPEHREDYTWGSAAFAVAGEIARAWTADVGPEGLAAGCELEGLPLYVTRNDQGEPCPVGPAETRLSTTRLEAYAWMGLIPIAALPGRDAARVAGLCSLARVPLQLP